MSKSAALAPFERIAEAIRDDIRHGTLKVGEKLPPHRDLAASNGVALATVQKALQVLQAEGWLTARATIGVFVNEPPAEVPTDSAEAVSRKLSELQAAVSDLTLRVKRIEDAG